MTPLPVLLILATLGYTSALMFGIEEERDLAVQWLSRERLAKLEIFRDSYDKMNLLDSFCPMNDIEHWRNPFFLSDEWPGVAFVHLVAHDNRFTRQKTKDLSSTFGAQYLTVSPRMLHCIVQNMPGSTIAYLANDTHSFDALMPMLQEGGRLIGDALLLPLVFPEIDYLWIMEDDVYFQNGRDVSLLLRAHEDDATDFLPASLFSYDQLPGWWYWPEVKEFPKHEWRGSYIPIARLSKRFISTLMSYPTSDLRYVEAFFPTLAVHHNLSMNPLAEQFVGKPAFEYGATACLHWRPCWTNAQISKFQKERDNARSGGVASDCMFLHPAKWLEHKGVFGSC